MLFSLCDLRFCLGDLCFCGVQLRARCGERRAGRVVGSLRRRQLRVGGVQRRLRGGHSSLCRRIFGLCRVQCRVCGIQLHLRRVPCINGGLGGNRLRGQPLVLRGAACGAHARVHLCLRRVAFGLGCVCPGLRRLIGGLLAGEVRRRRCGVIRFLGCGCGLPQCGQRGRQFRQACFSLGNSGLQCFHKLFGRGKLGLRVGQLLLFVVQQGLVFLDLRFGVDQRGLACRKLLLLLCQSAGQTFLIGLQLFFAAGDLFFRAVQLRLGVLQLRAPFVQLLFCIAQLFRSLCLGVFQLLPGVGQLLLGICFDFVVTGGAARAADRLHPVRHGVHSGLVFVRGAVQRLRAGHSGEDLAVSLLGKALFAHVHFQGDGAVADGGAFPIHREIIAGAHDAHDLELGICQRAAHVAVGGGDGQRIAHAQRSGSVDDVSFNQHTFVALNGQAALHHVQAVQIIFRLFFLDLARGQAVNACDDVLFFACVHEHVRHIGGHHLVYAVHGGDGCHVIVRQAQRADDAQVVHVLPVKVFVDGGAHIDGHGHQPRQEPNAQRHDGGDGDEAAEGALHGAQHNFPVCFFHSRVTTRSLPPGWGVRSPHWRWPARF